MGLTAWPRVKQPEEDAPIVGFLGLCYSTPLGSPEKELCLFPNMPKIEAGFQKEVRISEPQGPNSRAQGNLHLRWSEHPTPHVSSQARICFPLTSHLISLPNLTPALFQGLFQRALEG